MVILCVFLGTVQYWWISIGLVVVQLRAVFCPSVQYLPLFCEAFSWTIFDSSRFPLFHSGQVFHQLVCPLTVVLPQIFFNLTTLFSYPVFFSCFHAPLDVVVHFLVFQEACSKLVKVLWLVCVQVRIVIVEQHWELYWRQLQPTEGREFPLHWEITCTQWSLLQQLWWKTWMRYDWAVNLNCNANVYVSVVIVGGGMMVEWVCPCMCVHVCVHVCKCIHCVCVCGYWLLGVCMHVHVCVLLLLHIRMHMFACVHMHTCAQTVSFCMLLKIDCTSTSVSFKKIADCSSTRVNFRKIADCTYTSVSFRKIIDCMSASVSLKKM